MTNRYLLSFIVLSALVNAVPSRAEFHPIRCRNDPVADDIMGSGREIGECVSVRAAARDEAPEVRVARQWRDLAERVRRSAAFAPEEEKQKLLDLAAQYEARAERLLRAQRPS
jgi:hypothetical protein